MLRLSRLLRGPCITWQDIPTTTASVSHLRTKARELEQNFCRMGSLLWKIKNGEDYDQKELHNLLKEYERHRFMEICECIKHYNKEEARLDVESCNAWREGKTWEHLVSQQKIMRKLSRKLEDILWQQPPDYRLMDRSHVNKIIMRAEEDLDHYRD